MTTVKEAIEKIIQSRKVDTERVSGLSRQISVRWGLECGWCCRPHDLKGIGN